MLLETEMSTYTKELPSLLAQGGKYVLIGGSSVVGVFDTYREAMRAGYSAFKLDAFLVKQIASAQQIERITRTVNV